MLVLEVSLLLKVQVLEEVSVCVGDPVVMIWGLLCRSDRSADFMFYLTFLDRNCLQILFGTNICLFFHIRSQNT